MQAVILAGGLGTRLRPLVDDRPKPMAEIKGYPFLWYVIQKFKEKGINRFVLLVGYMWESIYEYFGNGEALGVSIEYSVEDRPMGTAGAVRLALPMLEEIFVLINGDTLVDFPGPAIINSHNLNKADITVMLSSPLEGNGDYGNVIIEQKTGKVLNFVEKQNILSDKKNAYINAGIYICRRSVFTGMPLKAISLESDILPVLCDKGTLFGFIADAKFVDIGVPERLQGLRQGTSLRESPKKNQNPEEN